MAPGCTAEIDDACFGGDVRPHNLAAEPVHRRLIENQSNQRQVVVAVRERGGRALLATPSGRLSALSAHGAAPLHAGDRSAEAVERAHDGTLDQIASSFPLRLDCAAYCALKAAQWVDD